MATAANKVRFGLKNVHYAVWDEATGKYGTPKRLAGAVSITFEPQGSQSKFYADDVAYYTSNPTATDNGTLTISDISEEAKKDIFGYKKDETTGILYEVTDAVLPNFALLYEVNGDQTKERGVRYNVTASRLSENRSTQNENVEPQTYSVNYTAIGRDFTVGNKTENVIKASCDNGGENHKAFDAWFTSVVCPGTAIA